MAAFGTGDPHEPKVRTALEVVRVAASVVLLVLIAWLVVDRGHGGFEYVVLLLGALGAVLGLPLLAQLMNRGKP